MKTLQTLTAAVLIILSTSAFAIDETATEKLSINYALQTYLDALSYGKIKGLSEIMDKDAKLTMNDGKKIITFNKAEILKTLKYAENTSQNCDTQFEVIEQSASQTIVKVTLKYPDFYRVNFISLSSTSTGWKITNISSVFK
jgi:hypothetical protein